MLKILALTYYFPRISETFILDQFLFVKKYCDLKIYSLFDPKKRKAEEDIRIEKEQHTEVRELISKTCYETNIPKLIVLKKLIVDHFDLLHFQFGELYSVSQKVIGSKKSLLTLHTDLNLKKLFEGSEIDKGSNILLLPTSRYLAEKCLRIFPGLPRKKIKLHYLGVDTNKYCPSDRISGSDAKSGFSVVLTGRFVPKKGHHTALKAFKIIATKIPNATLYFIGDGLLKKQIQTGIINLGLQNNVVLMGKMKREDVIELYKKVHVGIQPSETSNGEEEGLPTSIMEYSAIRLPVIATRHAGIPEIVKHKETGFLINERDYKMLAKYLLLLASDRKLAVNLGRTGRQLMLNSFNMEKQNIRLLKIYEQFIKN